MAYNLFGPLVADPALASRLLSRLLPGEIAVVEQVRIEWSPTPKEDYLADGSSFDVFIAARDPAGRRLAVCVETKLTEPFSDAVQDPERYLPLARRHADIWRPGRLQQLADRRWMQMWRNHLLAQALVDHPGSGFDAYITVVVAHSSDPELHTCLSGYRSLLTESGDDVVRVCTLDRIVDTWRRAISQPDVALRTWLEHFEQRYVRLDDSEPAWQSHRATVGRRAT